MVYLEHRRFLPLTDSLRNDTKNFPDLSQELRSPPSLKNMDFIDKYNGMYAAAATEKIRKKIMRDSGCKGSCALRSLPNYDRLNQVPVEPMHLIKNIAEHTVRLLSGIEDSIKVRNEEKQHNRFNSTWIDNSASTKKLPPAPFSLNRNEIVTANMRSKSIIVPATFDWKPRELFTGVGMKSHEWKEVMCSGIVKFCIRGLLGADQRHTIYKLCDTITKIHSPSITAAMISELEQDIHHVLALLERNFPVSLNVIVFHLLHHLPLYMQQYGPVFEYWMYPFERFNSWLGNRVMSKRYPESTVVETYRVYEWAAFLQMSGQLPAGSVSSISSTQLEEFEPQVVRSENCVLDDSLSEAEKYLCHVCPEGIQTVKFHYLQYSKGLGQTKITTNAIVSLRKVQNMYPVFGRVKLLFIHAFGELDSGVLVYVKWYHTGHQDEETNMFVVSTSKTCDSVGGPVVSANDTIGPYVTAQDEFDENDLWILNYNEISQLFD